jgi:fructose-bisphosphate aldolase class I
MRSVIHRASPTGIKAIVAQQLEVAEQIAAKGLVPIVEPEVSIKSTDRGESESLLRDAIKGRLDAWSSSVPVMLKLTIPEKPDFYAPLIAHPKVVKVVALSGGFTRDDACRRLAKNHGMIASFSRALVEGLTKSMSDAEFNATLGASIDEIYRASTVKVAAAA